VDAALAHSWPGNLRELENFVKRYLILGDEPQAIQELRTRRGVNVGNSAPSPAPPKSGNGDLKTIVRNLKDEAEIKAIGEALVHTNWNRKAASRLLKSATRHCSTKFASMDLRKSSAGPARDSSDRLGKITPQVCNLLHTSPAYYVMG